MEVRTAQHEDDAAIGRYIEKTEDSSIYHDYRWTSVIGKSFGHKCYYLVCEKPQGQIAGILPLVHLKSHLFGNLLVSMPYFNYGGVCADDIPNRDLLIDEAVRIANGQGASHIEFRQEKPLNNGFPAKTWKVSMRLVLPNNAEVLWKSLPSKLRNQVRKPQKEGMTARISRHEELESFYKIFSINMRDLGTPVYPKHFFRNILNLFPRNTWICTVYSGTVPVASGFLVGFKEKLEIPWASSIRKFNPLSPNMLLYWSCLEFACNQGFRVFDFGRSTLGEGTFQFKKQWGAVQHPMTWHYWMPEDRPLPEINPRNPKYRLAIGMWKRLPVPLTRLLGPHIVRNIP